MSRLRSGVLTVGAVLGSLCLLVALAGLLLDVKPLVFRSGSMGPEIPAGSIGLARPVAAPELEVGDVVSVIASDRTRVTHRILGIDGNGQSRNLTLQGDTNSVPDAETYPVTDADRVFWSVPVVGYAIAWLGTPVGLFVLGGAAVGVLMLGFRRPGPRGGGRRRASAAFVAPAVASVMLLQATSGTSAAFQDVATVNSGAISAYTVPKPVRVSCLPTGLVKTVTIVWQEVSSPYALDYAAVVDGTPLTVIDNGATRQVLVTSSLLGIGTSNVRITANLPTPNGAWVSVYLNQPVTFVTSLIATCGTPS